MQHPDKERFELLAEKMLRGTLTPDERFQLNNWFSMLENEASSSQAVVTDETEEILKARLLSHIKQDAGLVVNSKRRKIFIYNWQVAASLIIILGISAWFYYHKGKDVVPQVTVAQSDIAPGKNGAVLTLSDGRRISLDSSGNTSIAVQEGTQVINKNGALQYLDGKQANEKSVAYNTLFTPEGRQYKLILPDGSQAWLNAKSSCRYPVAFTGNSRTVEITGEVYFEVMHNAACPFVVKAGKTEVCVLGTHFNVNAYSDEEDVCTTLLQGAVKVTEGKAIKYLKPGQQSVIDPVSGNIQVVEADTEAAVAWKNGFFQFEGSGLAAMLRQLSRWYGIEVRYEGAVPNMRFGGKLKRSLPLSGVLKLLKEGGIRYTLQNRLLTILSDNQ